MCAAATPQPELHALHTVDAAPPADAVLDGSSDALFVPFELRELRRRDGPFWVRLRVATPIEAGGALIVRKGRHLHLQLTAVRDAERLVLGDAAVFPGFRALEDVVFALPHDTGPAWTFYVRVRPDGRGSEALSFTVAPLRGTLARGTAHKQVIALSCGALLALGVTALVVRSVLPDALFLLYGLLVLLQALYVAFLSGQGFSWPLLSAALPLGAHAWNVPAALSGAVACLFVRRIADLKHFSPRIYRTFGWLALAFLVLAAANLGDLVGIGRPIVVAGNALFLGAAAFALLVAFFAWRRGNRAAGWFLIAWGQLEVFTIATAVRLLLPDAEDAETLLYYGLPLSMVAAAVLIALGVADRMREQRRALSEAERQAQTDPLTGVLNRRSLIERLEAACQRGRANDEPIALLFIDLDHFKRINDDFGHAAGDACLAAIIEPIQAELRHSDAIGRYGGEEFVVVLSGADSAAAHAIAERILTRVADVRVAGFGADIRLTCSIGVAASDTLGVRGAELLAQADAAVYAAKRQGRNRVVQLAMAQAASSGA